MNTVTQFEDAGEDNDMYFQVFSNAFDIVNHWFHYFKIATFGVSALVIGWIRSHIAYHTFQLRIGDEVSEEAAVPNRVPQGSFAGVLLSLIMVNDLPNDLQLFRRFFC